MTTALALVQLFYERLAQSDVTGAISLLTDDVELIQADSLPYGGRFVGHEGIRNFFDKFFASWQQFQSDDMTFFASDQQVVVTSVARGTTRKGESIVMPMVQVYNLRANQICRVQPFYFDTARLLF